MEHFDWQQIPAREYGVDIETLDSHTIVRGPDNKLTKVIWYRPDGSKRQIVEYDEKGDPIRFTTFDGDKSETTTDQAKLAEANTQAMALLNEKGEF